MTEDMRLLVTLAFWAHLRLGEVLALQRGDVLLDKRQLRVQRQVVEVDGQGSRLTEPKAGSRRTISLPTPAVDALREHLRRLSNVWVKQPLYFLTACTHERRPILTAPGVPELLIEAWRTLASNQWMGRWPLCRHARPRSFLCPTAFQWQTAERLHP